MKILVISPQVPYPLIDGGRKAIFYPIKYLTARGHSICMACLSDTDEPVMSEELERYCSLHVIRNSKKRTIGGLVRSMWDPTPYVLSRFHNGRLLSLALSLVEQGLDIVQIEGLHCAYYGLEIMKQFNVPVVLRLHNVESVILDRFTAFQSNAFLKAYVRFENKRLRSYESSHCPTFDRVMMISRTDEAALQARTSGVRTVVVQSGVDTNYFVPEPQEQRHHCVLWIGAFRWLPNQDSFWWFVKDIVPLIARKVTDVSIYVVGSHPPPEVLVFSHPNVKVVGYVEDIREYINKCAVAVVPLRIGGGIRLKLLELFAMKRAVVSTSVGCEGLEVEHNRQLLIADDADGFAESVVQLLSDPVRRKVLSDQAAAHVLSRYSWEAIAGQHEKVYQDVIRNRTLEPR
jgi:glycosyltransferase involved in cell wall biosynthesis